MDARHRVLLRVDGWKADTEVAGLLHEVPELGQYNRKIVEMLPDGRARYIPSDVLRIYISSVCSFVNENGKSVHPTGRLVSSVKCLGHYPGLRYIDDFEIRNESICDKIKRIKREEKLKKDELKRIEDEAKVKRISDLLLMGWTELPGSKEGLTTVEAIDILGKYPNRYETLRAALRHLERDQHCDLPYCSVISDFLWLIHDVVNNGRYMERIVDKEGIKWAIRRIENH